MLRKVIFLCIFLFNLSGISATGILDFFWEPSVSSFIEKREDAGNNTQKTTCTCNGPTCNCCVDFNMTYIDLGGPGCVEMKYISQNDGITVNVSYGNSKLHSEQVKGPNPPPTCMSLLASFAEVCARFSTLEPHDDGLRGCLLLEPKLLGDTQAHFDIGCFLMGNNGMGIDFNSNSTLNDIITNVQDVELNAQNGTTETEGFTEEELIAVVNESAEKGLLFFGNLLGLTFSKSDSDENTSQFENTTQTSVEPIQKSRNTSRNLNKI